MSAGTLVVWALVAPCLVRCERAWAALQAPLRVVVVVFVVAVAAAAGPFVHVAVAALGEALFAVLARIGLFARVHSNVHFQSRGIAESLWAQRALVPECNVKRDANDCLSVHIARVHGWKRNCIVACHSTEPSATLLSLGTKYTVQIHRGAKSILYIMARQLYMRAN